MLLVKQILGGIKEPSDIKWVDPFQGGDLNCGIL